MSYFAKSTTLLKQLSDSHDMAAATTRTGRAQTLILIQVKDDAGFWCNAATAPTVRIAGAMAREYLANLRCLVRVVVGAERTPVLELRP